MAKTSPPTTQQWPPRGAFLFAPTIRKASNGAASRGSQGVNLQQKKSTLRGILEVNFEVDILELSRKKDGGEGWSIKHLFQPAIIQGYSKNNYSIGS